MKQNERKERMKQNERKERNKNISDSMNECLAVFIRK
jgi:hypothetical protein